MRDYCTYTIEAVDRTQKSDEILRRINFDFGNDVDIDIAAEAVVYHDGTLTIYGHIWHDEINALLISEMEKHDAQDITLCVCGIDNDVYFEDAPTCSFVGYGRAVYVPVKVTVDWPEFNEDLHSELKGV